jgi:hypothetical protein
MPVVQTAYTATMRPGLEGQVATEWGGANKTETRLVEGTAGIGFGRAVGIGTGVKGAVLSAAAIANFIGVSVRDVTLVIKEGETVDKYQNGSNMSVLNEGDIWLRNTAAVVAGTTVTYLAADGTFAPATGIAIPGSRWLTSAATNGIAAARFTRAYHST